MHLVIDSTGLKVFGEGEWAVKKHGKERRRIWRNWHLAVDGNTLEIVCADLSRNNVTNSESFPALIRQTHRRIRTAAADGPYDTLLCHDGLARKRLFLPEKEPVTGPLSTQIATGLLQISG